MITLGIDPVILNLGHLEIRWYGVMVALAVATIVIISILEAKRVGISKDHIYSVALWAIIGGIVGARLVHVIDKWDYYIAHPRQIVGFEGVAVYGAVIGAVLAVLIYTWLKKISFWQLGDIIAPGAILGQAIGRIGCTINGCCYGLPTSLPWAVVYTHPDSYALIGIPIHPAQVYHLLWNLAAFAVIWKLRRSLTPQGSLFLIYLALYAAGDFSIRFLRAGEPSFLGMQQAQLIGIGILVVTVPWLIVKMRQAKAETIVPDTETTSKINQMEQNQGD